MISYGHTTHSRTAVIGALAILAALTLAGCGTSGSPHKTGTGTGTGTGDGTTPAAPVPCPSNYPTRGSTSTTIENEKKFLDEIWVCIGKTAKGQNAYLLINNSNSVWYFEKTNVIAAGVTPESQALRDSVPSTAPAERPFMAPGEQFVIAEDNSWHIDASLSYVWLGQQQVEQALEKAAGKGAVKILGAGSKSREAAVGCGLSIAGLFSDKNLDGHSTEASVAGLLDGATTAASCTDAVEAAAPELGAEKSTLVQAVEDVGKAAETTKLFHEGWTFVHDFCAINPKC